MSSTEGGIDLKPFVDKGEMPEEQGGLMDIR
jgi:hypothetical protein